MEKRHLVMDRRKSDVSDADSQCGPIDTRKTFHNPEHAYTIWIIGLMAQRYSDWMSKCMSWVRLRFLWLSGTAIGCRSVCLGFAWGSCGSVEQRLDVEVYVLGSLGVLVAQWYSDWMSRCMSWVRLGFLWLSGRTIGCRSVCLGFAWGSCGSVVQRLDVEVYV
ncbi:hypothetical protein Bpfe_029098 [Biomphalaria pfeifferi]|uniref:Uncharacterized protein n=1 Tax=Biomphalaria pfeifferi TaxID=112525 RepID=A0AAD8ATS9_BIOPF|nr:hypothetical protein Bpfe_029098 [Biomphalaria pfeifferi]